MVRFSLIGFGVAAMTISPSAGQECTLDCPIDAPCTLGDPDFADHSALELHHFNGQHCACPPGWTGLLCDHKYESCTDQVQCYHGGECITGLQDKFGNDQLYCDCTNARGAVGSDTIKYVGKYCETPFDNVCDESGETFCVNGGTCNPDFPNRASEPCLCDEGWEGYHCEFKKGKVPDCTLDCKNDGACIVGVVDPAEAEKLHHVWNTDEIESHMRCVCPPDFGGPLCESTSEECGDEDIECYHGGTCVTTTTTTQFGVTHTEYRCDCTTAADGQDRFAGQYCQFKSDTYCSEDDDNLFCVNGGTCKANPLEGCACPEGFTGFKCEYPQASKEDKPHHHQDENKDDSVECGDLYCLNGGKCVEKTFELEDGTQGSEMVCDCSDAYDETDLFAGSACQYKSTSFCTQPAQENGNLAGVMFCVHGGTCKDDPDEGCDCPDGWTGSSCEVHSLEEKQPNDPACGDGNVCLNGGSCVETEIVKKDGSVESVSHCDCSTAFDEKFLFAGESCQFPSTRLCTHPQNGESLEGHLFCTNHGTCGSNVLQGCDCPDGFTGFSCEFETVTEDPDAPEVDYEDLDLCGDVVCHNGGTCVTSMVATPDGGERQQQHCDCSTAVTNETAFAGESCEHEASVFCTLPKEGMGLESSLFCVNGGQCAEHVLQGCECPTGWTGFRCEFSEDTDEITGENDDQDEENDMEECGDNYCFNGGKCQMVQMDENGTSQVPVCDCASAFTDSDLFEGPYCQYRSTSICTQPPPQNGGSLEGQLFCVNHGTCRDNASEGCDCPSGWEGTMCQFEVEDDSHADEGKECGEGYCYHGGECVTTKIVSNDGQQTTEYHCDCSTAYDDTDLYAGESCEYKSTSFCSRPKNANSLEGTLFCVNGGSCLDNANQGCDCPPEWTGFSCEYPTDAEDIAEEDDIAEVEVCGDLVCLNGGVCTTTVVTLQDGTNSETKHCDCATAYTDDDIFAGPQCEYKATSFCTAHDGDDLGGVQFCVNGGTCKDNILQGCECPTAWTGFKCEFQVDAEDLDFDGPKLVDDYVECGDNFCYHGGTCNPFEVNGKQHFSCDCTAAVTDTDLYAGKFCQYKSTSFCTQPVDDTLAGIKFCVNGGQCRDEGGCGCPTGYEGLRCEFSLIENEDSEDNIAPNDGNYGDDDDEEYACHLQCNNGGVCAKGAKDLGSLQSTVEHVAHLNQTYDDDFFEHCICPDGWAGLQCEHQVELCGKGEHVCLHGSTCVKNDQEHGCDCSNADEHIGDSDPLFTGDSCQHVATDICIEGENYPGRPLYFCVNQGRCKAYVTGEDENPGCDCVHGWTGPHCEIRIQAITEPSDSRFAERRGAQIFFIVLLAVIAAVFVLICASYCVRKRAEDFDESRSCLYFRRRRRTGRSPHQQQANLAPSGRESINPPSVFSSSSDPITKGLTLPPDDEPEPYQDEPTEPYHDEPYHDEPVLVNIGPPKDEDGHELHNVDFLS